jgi:hypothetical protein
MATSIDMRSADISRIPSVALCLVAAVCVAGCSKPPAPRVDGLYVASSASQNQDSNEYLRLFADGTLVHLSAHGPAAPEAVAEWLGKMTLPGLGTYKLEGEQFVFEWRSPRSRVEFEGTLSEEGLAGMYHGVFTGLRRELSYRFVPVPFGERANLGPSDVNEADTVVVDQGSHQVDVFGALRKERSWTVHVRPGPLPDTGEPDDPVTVYIFKDLPNSYRLAVGRIGLDTVNNNAYLWPHGAQISTRGLDYAQNIRTIDPSLSNADLAAEFGVERGD